MSYTSINRMGPISYLRSSSRPLLHSFDMVVFCFVFKTSFLVVLILMSASLLPGPAEADIRAVNNCSYPLTVFHQGTGENLKLVNLGPGEKAMLGVPRVWQGSIWASQHNNSFMYEATVAEFYLGQSFYNLDLYDISIVNAYNEAVSTKVTSHSGEDEANKVCGTVTCSIPDLSKVCKLNNYYDGPDHACINANGTAPTPNPSTNLFQKACPDVYAWSTYSFVHTYNCTVGGQYDTIWCP